MNRDFLNLVLLFTLLSCNKHEPKQAEPIERSPLESIIDTMTAEQLENLNKSASIKVRTIKDGIRYGKK